MLKKVNVQIHFIKLSVIYFMVKKVKLRKRAEYFHLIETAYLWDVCSWIKFCYRLPNNFVLNFLYSLIIRQANHFCFEINWSMKLNTKNF